MDQIINEFRGLTRCINSTVDTIVGIADFMLSYQQQYANQLTET